MSMSNVVKLFPGESAENAAARIATAAANAAENGLSLVDRINRARRQAQEREQNRQNAAAKVDELNGHGADALNIPPVEHVDGGGMYDGWKGGKAGTWHSDKELKAFLMADFKKAGIKASVRFNRAGYLTSITVTITISANDVKSFEAWAEDWRPSFSGWLCYTNEAGRVESIFAERFYGMSEAEQAKLLPNIKRTEYDAEVRRLTECGCSHSGKEDVLTDNGNKIFETVQAIVTSYNHDQSNGQIDYFDRDIYDHYTFKVK